MKEEWKEIPNTKGTLVSNIGNVKTASGKLKNQDIDSEGYKRVSVCFNGTWQHVRVHRLVAQAFKPNPYGKPLVNHRNGKKWDNKVKNLEWCTHRENALLASKNHQYCPNHLKRHERIVAVNIDDKSIVTYASQLDAARQLGINDSEVNKCLRGKRKTSHRYRFYYESDYIKEGYGNDQRSN